MAWGMDVGGGGARSAREVQGAVSFWHQTYLTPQNKCSATATTRTTSSSCPFGCMTNHLPRPSGNRHRR